MMNQNIVYNIQLAKMYDLGYATIKEFTDNLNSPDVKEEYPNGTIIISKDEWCVDLLEYVNSIDEPITIINDGFRLVTVNSDLEYNVIEHRPYPVGYINGTKCNTYGFMQDLDFNYFHLVDEKLLAFFGFDYDLRYSLEREYWNSKLSAFSFEIPSEGFSLDLDDNSDENEVVNSDIDLDKVPEHLHASKTEMGDSESTIGYVDIQEVKNITQYIVDNYDERYNDIMSKVPLYLGKVVHRNDRMGMKYDELVTMYDATLNKDLQIEFTTIETDMGILTEVIESNHGFDISRRNDEFID
jgi:hypothetical protein